MMYYNAGLFIILLQPYHNAYNIIILKIIDRQYQYIIDTNQSYPFFTRGAGWGHHFVSMNDYWTAIITEGKGWVYHASHSDQGLLFYYTKYYLQDVTIVIGTSIENWIGIGNTSQSSSNDTTIMKRDDLNETLTYGTGHTLPIKINEYNSNTHIYPYSDMTSKPIYYSNSCVKYHKMINEPGYIYPTRMSAQKHARKVYDFLCHVPYSNYEHFYGATKPWQQSIKQIQNWITTLEPIPDDTTNTNITENYNKRNIQYTDSYLLWFHTLRDIIWRNHPHNNNNITNYVDDINNNKNETNKKNEYFMYWWLLQGEKIRQSPLGYMAKWKEHTERFIEYHSRTNQSIPINFKNYHTNQSSES